MLWQPEGDCRLLLMVVHGMTEHLGRYEAFARSMTEHGIAVAGFDLPGHGKNPGDPVCASMGEAGWRDSLQSLHRLNASLQEAFPGLPRAMLGFSLGSFLVRDFLRQEEAGLSGVILLGTGDQPAPVLRLLKAIVRGQIRRAGFDHTTPLVQALSLGAYNRKFAPNRTRSDWLCADTEALDAYLADPLCRQDISAGLFWQLLDGMQRTGGDSYASWRRDLPVLLLSGGDDPVGNAGKGVRALEKKMKRGGLTHVTVRLIPGARHDLLHEKQGGCAAAAEEAILRFLQTEA